MSQTKYRYIRIPTPVIFVSPDTKEPIEGAKPCSFRQFILMVMDNPKWKNSYEEAVAARNIMTALDTASSTGAKTMVVLEEDWAKLEEAVRNPKQFITTPLGPRVEPGFGWMPSVTPQILPMMDAIIGASNKAPESETSEQAPQAQA